MMQRADYKKVVKILQHLSKPKRFNELLEDMDWNPKPLSDYLKYCLSKKLVARAVGTTSPISCTYTRTPKGVELLKCLMKLDNIKG